MAEACARSSREACDPFRDLPQLRRAVRVLAWEQAPPRPAVHMHVLRIELVPRSRHIYMAYICSVALCFDLQNKCAHAVRMQCACSAHAVTCTRSAH